LAGHIDQTYRSPSVAAAKPALLMAIYAHADYFPPTINAARILSRDFRARVVCRNTEGPAAKWLPELEIERAGPRRTRAEQEQASAPSKLLEFGHYVRALGRALSRTDAKIIYAYDPIAFAAAMLARTRDLPVVFHCHDNPPVENLPGRSMQSWLIRYALRRTSDAAFVVFPERNRAAHWLAASHDNRAPLVVPNGAPRDFYPPPLDWTAVFARRFTDRRVLYMSSMGPDNGHLEAVAAALYAGLNLDFCGPCTPEFRAELERLIDRKDAGGRISVKGWLSDRDRKALLDSSAVGLVLYKPTSLNWEHSASAVNKLFEYGAAGLPVVVPDRKSYREFLGGEEWVAFVDVEDPRSIARAIEDVLGDRDRYIAMSRAARDAHEDRFNYELLFAPIAARLRAMAGIGDQIAAA
jgi:glycosyltransferase involved in cell wall biosynthesis